jgi:hypothetical protein
MNPEQSLKYAIELLQDAPFHWRVTWEYPGYALVAFNAGDDDGRGYVFGDAPTLWIQKIGSDGYDTGVSIDTGLPLHELDGYRIAIQVAAAIDRMENAR